MRLLMMAAILLFPLTAFAQSEALDELLESPASVGGLDGEIDADMALGDAVEEGKDTGLSTRQRNTVEEIVVSARKRDELLEETPVSVTALDANSLAEAGVSSLSDVRTLVPNFQFEGGPISLATSSNLRIRGVGTPGIGGSFEPGVGVYLDGLYFARSMSALLDVVDIAQIEVLRGPQGTLFGKNTVGGALNITSTKPGDLLEASFSLRGANFGTIETRSMLNVPITDRIATRVAFSSKNSDGWVDNTLLDQTLFNRNSIGFLGSIRFLLTDDLTLDISGNYAQNHSRGQAAACLWQEGAEPAFGPSLLPGLQEACEETTPRTSTANVDPLFRDSSSGIWSTLNWDIGAIGIFDELNLLVRGSWRKSGSESRLDLDGTVVPALAIDLTEAGGAGGVGGTGYVAETQTNFAAFDNRVNGVFGIFGFYEDIRIPTNIITENILFSRDSTNTSKIKNWDLAAYGQVSVAVTEWLEATVGLRWTQEKKGVELQRLTLQNGEVQEEASNSKEEKFSKWTPMASLSATMPEEYLDGTSVEHLMAYFTYSEGFRGGGFNSAALGPITLDTFQPEVLQAFEVGVKSSLLESRLNLSLSAFLYNYENLQVQASNTDCIDPDDPTSCATTTAIENAASANSKGLELEIQSRPFGPLLVTASAGLLDAVYASFPDAPPELSAASPDTVVDRSGESFNNSPALQTHVALMAPLPVNLFSKSWMNGYLVPRIDWYYQSAVHFNAVEVTASRQGGYNLLHARLSYDFLDDSAQVALFGQNLTDEDYLLFTQNLSPFFGIVSGVYGQPRTFGVDVTYRFN